MRPTSRSLALALAAGFLTVGTPAKAQEVREYGTTTRGLVRSGADMAEAAALLARTSVSCTITDARLRGRNERGLSQYEVACESGPGFYILSYPEVTAVSCLALSARREARAPECRLPANRNVLGHYRRAALAAGVACDVDRGRYVGLTLGGGEIYEVGCDGVAGGWVVRNREGSSFKSCLIVEVEGGTCTLTTPAERLATAGQLLQGSPVEACTPVEARFMGASAGVQHYEVRCRAGDHVVARLPRDGGVADIVPCDAAIQIGGGCRFTP
jgi:hypothetical protein